MGCDRFVWTKPNMPDRTAPASALSAALSNKILKLLSVVIPWFRQPVGDPMEITLPDQIKLHFDKAGLGNPTFIFIHGGGADTSHLAPQFYFFARRGTAINLD